MSRFEFRTIPVESLDAAARTFLYEELYQAWGVEGDADWLHESHGGVFVVASEGGDVVGLARLLPPGSATNLRQLRQVVVASRLRRSGLGRTLVGFLEDLAREEGATEVWLNARESAFAFYEALGYLFAGESFRSDLTGIPHRCMRKQLA